MTVDDPDRSLEYDPDDDRYVLSPSPDGRLTVEAVLAVAEIADVDPTEIDPLYEFFDADEFDSMYDAYRDGGIDGEATVTVANHRVTIGRAGKVVIEPPE